MFSREKGLQEVRDSIEQLRGQLDLLRQEWKDWRRQLVKAAARLERAERREGESNGDRASKGAPPPDTVTSLNEKILRARGEGRAVQVGSDGAGSSNGGSPGTGAG